MKMPTGRQNTSHSNARRKEDVSEKIREIKQRQQNWLVQREQSKSKDNVDISQKTYPAQKPSSSAGASSKVSSYKPTIQTHNPSKSDQGKKRVTDTFNHWKKSRESSLPNEDDTISIQSDVESELERLVSPDVDTSHPVAEEEFGSLADKIASRVKQNMGLSGQYVTRNTKVYEESVVETLGNESSLRPSRSKTYVQSQPTFNHNNTASALTSHHCPECKQLMYSSEHIPLMIIPCGHTICKACSLGKPHCPECNCSVVSLTVNIMLQQVIHEYHSHNQGVSHTETRKSPQRSSSGNTYSNAGYVEDNRRNKTASYRSQLQNLHTRQSVLSDEHNELVGKLGSLDNQIQHTSSQTKSIANQEHEVKKAIVDLQDKLVALETHRKQYESQLTDLHEEKSETEGKITLLSGTLASLFREIEKVKLLAEGEQNLD